MQLPYRLGLLLAALLLNSSTTAVEMPQTRADSPLQILASDAQHIVVELTVPHVQTETVAYAEQTYHRLLIPGMVQTATPGAPQVPTRGALLGVPSTAGIAVHVLKADYDLLHGYRLSPAPALQGPPDTLEGLPDEDIQRTVTRNSTLYTTDAFYPGVPVAIGSTGFMRDQAVAQVQFYPVQYNPVTGEVRLYRRLRVQIIWERSLPGITTEASQAASPVYEHLLRQTLLNYTALQRPAAEIHASPLRATDVGRVEAGSATLALKIGVIEDGLYLLTSDDLTGAGFNLSGVDPRTITLHNRGVEIPISIAGQEDGVFDPSDYILFYGTAITDLYTTTNVYWLTTGGALSGRMNFREGTLTGTASVPTQFPATHHAEQDTFYWQRMPNGASQDHWFWGDKLTAPASRDHVLMLPHVALTAGPATLRVRLQGSTDIPELNPDHHTKILLNGIEIDEQWWDGQSIYEHEVLVPHTSLQSGTNTVTVETVGDTGAIVDQVFVNWIEINYEATYMAEDDALRFGAPTAGTFHFQVTGFHQPEVVVLDVTDPTQVVRMTNTTVVTEGSTSTLQFEDTAQPETRYLALTPAQYKSPASLELHEPSSWHSPVHGADYIIITHEDFYPSALTLAAHRSASGLRVATVKVEDIYDEFNHGVFHPQAIRDFLAYAYYSWIPPAPTYVVLLGDAAQDYKDNLQTGTVNYVPSQLIETDFWGEFPSDNWFVTVSGDDVLPDLMIGRLPAQTIEEAEVMVAKILHYEQEPPDASWNMQVLLVADDDEQATFETTSEALAALLPQGYTAHRVYFSHYPPGDPTADIIQAFDRGSVLVNYAGHGNLNRWGLRDYGGGTTVFDLSDVETLTNTYRLPVVTVADCLNGFFTGPKRQTSLAEAFLRLPDRGAVAVWAPTTLGFASGHRVLMEAFYTALFQDGGSALGAATTIAKLAAYAQDSFWGELVETYVLFGDPAMHLGLPIASLRLREK